MRDEFERQLALLNEELTTMGGLIESAIANAVKALDGDEHSINKAYDYEKSIDNKEREIESLSLKLLLTQQPVASDLRLISAALKNDNRYGTYWRSGGGYSRNRGNREKEDVEKIKAYSTYGGGNY